jgi:hypothetical protein
MSGFLLIDGKLRTAQQHVNTPVTIAHKGLAYLPDPLFEMGLSGATRFVVTGGSVGLRHPAGLLDRPASFQLKYVT